MHLRSLASISNLERRTRIATTGAERLSSGTVVVSILMYLLFGRTTFLEDMTMLLMVDAWDRYAENYEEHLAAKCEHDKNGFISAPFNTERNAAASWHRMDGNKHLDNVLSTILTTFWCEGNLNGFSSLNVVQKSPQRVQHGTQRYRRR